MSEDRCPKCRRCLGRHYEGCSLDPFIKYMGKIGASLLGTIPSSKTLYVNLRPITRDDKFEEE